MSIVQNSKELVKRNQFIKQIVKPILTGKGYREYNTQFITDSIKNELYFYLGDTRKYEQELNKYASLLTSKYPFYFTYEEKWAQTRVKDTFKLIFSNLHIYRIKNRNDAEDFLFLHTEFENKKGAELNEYKKKPHIHVKCAQYPLPKSHICIFLYSPETFLTEINSFNEALIKSVQMIKDQILDMA